MQLHESSTSQPQAAVAGHLSLLGIASVAAATGLSVPTIYRRLRAGRFPKPIQFNARCNMWPAAAVQAWVANPDQGTDVAGQVSA